MGLLEGRVVLVTSDGHFAQSTAPALAREGARLVLDDRGTEGAPAAALAAAVVASGGAALARSDGLSDPASCDRLVTTALDRWGQLDALLVHIDPGQGPRWGAAVASLDGLHNAIDAALGALSRCGGSVIVVVGGGAGVGPTLAGGCVQGLIEAIAPELSRQGVRLNGVLLRSAADAERASGLVTYLASELCGEAGDLFLIDGARLGLIPPPRPSGITQEGGLAWSAPVIRDCVAELRSRPSLWGAVTPAEARLDDDTAIAPLSARAWPIGKRYDGGFWLVDRDEFIAYADATDDPNPAYRGPDAVAPPMYHVRPFIGLLEELARDPELELELIRLVHGEHAVRFHRLLHHGDVLQLRATLERVQSKSSGRVVTFALYGMVDGALALEGTTTFFVRGQRSGGSRSVPALSEAPPTWSTPQEVTADQAVRYAHASGDHNPIHVDEAAARSAGLPQTILHGLCTMAFAQRDLIQGACGGDPRRLVALSVRFARPVLPADTLTLQVWEPADGPLSFVTLGSDGQPVIVNGRAEIAPADAPTG